MPNKMIIDASHPEETRVVVLRGSRVEEFDFESASKKPLRGNIYLAKVTRVEPSLQAAFVDYGGNRHGFLAFSEIHPDYYQIPGRRPSGAARRGGALASRGRGRAQRRTAQPPPSPAPRAGGGNARRAMSETVSEPAPVSDRAPFEDELMLIPVEAEAHEAPRRCFRDFDEAAPVSESVAEEAAPAEKPAEIRRSRSTIARDIDEPAEHEPAAEREPQNDERARHPRRAARGRGGRARGDDARRRRFRGADGPRAAPARARTKANPSR